MSGVTSRAHDQEVMQLEKSLSKHNGSDVDGLGRSGGVSPEEGAPRAGRRHRRRMTREELAPEAREMIFRAAMLVIGQHGYAGATIERVTKAAGIAQGTFYLYFESRQALFDEILPYFGAQMLDFIRQRVRRSRDILDKEERGFRAFIDYMRSNPGFFRLLTEAKGAAPEAHSKHFEQITKPYVGALRRGLNSANIRHFGDGELEVVAYMLMAAREYLYLRYFERDTNDTGALDTVVRTYMGFVRKGFGLDGSQ